MKNLFKALQKKNYSRKIRLISKEIGQNINEIKGKMLNADELKRIERKIKRIRRIPTYGEISSPFGTDLNNHDYMMFVWTPLLHFILGDFLSNPLVRLTLEFVDNLKYVSLLCSLSCFIAFSFMTFYPFRSLSPINFEALYK